MNLVKEITGILLRKQGQGTLKAHMVRGTVGTFALKVVNTVLAFGTSLLLARLLGAKEYGVYAYAISWASLLSVPAVMGLNTLLVREVARYKTLEDWGSLRGILRWSDRVVLVTSVGLAGLFALIVWVLRGRFSPDVRPALWLAMALVPLLAFLLLNQGGLQGLGHVVEAQVPEFLILPGIFLILVSALYFATGLSGTTAVGLRILAGLIAVFVAFFLLKKAAPESLADFPPVYHRREWLKSALPLLFVGVAGMISQQVPIIAVGSLLGPKAAGIFNIASKMAWFVSFTLMAANVPLAPTVSSLFARKELPRLQRVVTKTARLAAVGAGMVLVIFVIFGRELLGVFGPSFVEGYVSLLILSIGEFLNAMTGSVGLVLVMTGHEFYSAKGHGIAALACLALSFTLTYYLGLIGAALATAITTILWNMLLAIWMYKKVGLLPTAFVKLNKGGTDA